MPRWSTVFSNENQKQLRNLRIDKWLYCSERYTPSRILSKQKHTYYRDTKVQEMMKKIPLTKTMHFQMFPHLTSCSSFEPQNWLSVCLTGIFGNISTPWVRVLIFWWDLLPVAWVSHTQVANSVQCLIDYNWLENKALIRYLLANETGYSSLLFCQSLAQNLC